MTTDRELIRELLDEQEDLAASARKAELRDQLLHLHALLEPLADGTVYAFSRLGSYTRRAPHAEVERPTLHYAGVVSGGWHFITGRAAAVGRVAQPFSARAMAAHLLELGVTADQVTVLRGDAATALAEPATFQVGDRVRTTGHRDNSTWDEAIVVEVQPTFLPYRVENSDGVWFWFAPEQLTKLDG